MNSSSDRDAGLSIGRAGRDGDTFKHDELWTAAVTFLGDVLVKIAGALDESAARLVKSSQVKSSQVESRVAVYRAYGRGVGHGRDPFLTLIDRRCVTPDVRTND